jgi:hypothetical protein
VPPPADADADADAALAGAADALAAAAAFATAGVAEAVAAAADIFPAEHAQQRRAEEGTFERHTDRSISVAMEEAGREGSDWIAVAQERMRGTTQSTRARLRFACAL